MGVNGGARGDKIRRGRDGTLKNPALNHKSFYHEIIGKSSKKCKGLKGKHVFGGLGSEGKGASKFVQVAKHRNCFLRSRSG